MFRHYSLQRNLLQRTSIMLKGELFLCVYAALKTLIKPCSYFDLPNSMLFMYLLLAVLYGMLDLTDFAF